MSSKQESLWNALVKLEERPPLCQEITVDAVIVGGGMAGILTASLLQKKGISCAVLEKNRIASGVTCNTTAKVTAQHGAIYQKILTEVGKPQAVQYAAANIRAVERFSEIIGSRGIDCDLIREDAYLYSTNSSEVIYEEIKAACSVGIEMEFVVDTALPFAVKGAARLKNQLQVNPLKLIGALAKELTVYEHSEAIEVSETGVITGGGKVNAKVVILTTHYPFINSPGYYFMRMHQERSCVLALKKAPALNGMYLGIDPQSYSFRNSGEFLLFGGAGYRTGQNTEGGSYDSLRRAAKEFFPGAQESYHWSAQDCMTIDSIPFIGKYSSSTKNLYVATGFNKWGMTSSMVSAMVLTSMITGEACEFAPVFSPQRFNAAAATGNLLRDGMKAAKNMTLGKLVAPVCEAQELRRGQGGIVSYQGNRVGGYRDKDGELFLVSPKCTHMGCMLSFNPEEKSWDCPCHGSRFSYDGSVLNGPATQRLTRY